jgi:hypothetical protein
MKIKAVGSSAINKSISLLILAACTFAFGCKDGGTAIWSADTPSPDRNWVASASTKQWSGPGTAYVGTSVYLKRRDDSKPPVEILEFANDSAYPTGITNVEMTWLTPSHLEVAYRGHATLNFQAVKCAGIDISVRDLSTEAIDIPVNP